MCALLSILRDGPFMSPVYLCCSPTGLYVPQEHVIFVLYLPEHLVLGFP